MQKTEEIRLCAPGHRVTDLDTGAKGTVISEKNGEPVIRWDKPAGGADAP